MDKLLHERLRDVKDDSETIKVSPGLKVLMSKKFCNELADEINKYYIPRPRFEDGEPVQFGDASEYIENVEAMLFRANGSFETHQRSDSGIGVNVVFYERGETIKRPTPKVLDADGVEIKVGDTVYAFECDLKGKVLYFDVPNGSVQTDVGKFKPEQLTHEKPVFDAEGVRICKGDTVWTIGTGIECEVTGFDSLEDSIRVITKETNSDLTGLIAPDLLTHREPDSVERIKEDRKLSNEEYRDKYGLREAVSPSAHMLSRAIALIERGA